MLWSYLFVVLIIGINRIYCWKEASKCTNPVQPVDLQESSHELKVLNLDCGTDLIFISWAHYGYKQSNDTCYFSPKDCTVSVEYVSNECNGLSSCQVSLDSQYLHSCKAYSNYLFIIYDCVKAKSTFNLCDEIDSKIETNQNGDSIFYFQSPDYPNEYMNNLDCNCTIKSNAPNYQIQIDLLEFDLESSSSSINQLTSSQNFRPFRSNQPSKLSTNNSVCQRDLFILDSNTHLCGTLNSFTSLLNDNNKTSSKYTQFRFKSDDALTRRGFWFKVNIKTYQLKCPDNFILINNLCIKIYNELLTWYEANTYCSNLGYSLALIDNFEIEKQLNKALFDAQDSLEHSIFNEPNRKSSVKNFWIGMRQLNQTNWFDAKNQALNFREDEKNWWPWLVVDSSTYSQGSCVAKKKGFFYLQDCYKRMPFACQFNTQKVTIKSDDLTKNHLKCGKNSGNFDSQEYSIQPSTKSQQIFYSINTKSHASSMSSTSRQNSTIKFYEPLVLQSSDDNLNLKLEIKSNDNNNSDKTSSNQTNTRLLASLILGFLILLILINSLVVLFVLRKRKLLLKESQNSQIIEKDSKISSLSNHDTINSSNTSQNADFTNEEFMQFSNTVSNTASSALSYNCLANLNFNLINQSQNEPSNVYNILSNFNKQYAKTLNQPHQRQSLFINRNTLAPNFNNSPFALISSNQPTSTMINSNRLAPAGFLANKNDNNDSLGHVYETISVSNGVNSMCTDYGEYDQFNNDKNDFLLVNDSQKYPYKFRAPTLNHAIENQRILCVNNSDSRMRHLNEQLMNQKSINRTQLSQYQSMGAIV